MRLRPLLVSLALLPSISRASDDPLATLRPAHPRLMATADDFARLRSLIQTDPTAKSYFTHLQSVAEQLLKQPVSQRVLIGPRLLSVSRQVVGRTATLGLLYKLTGDKRYAARCRDEMLAVAHFSDWHPPHFLDTAEMTNGMAIGYDWTYDALTPEERTEIAAAIVNLGLKPGLAVYASNKGWHKVSMNWNNVCNGGLAVGALAVADTAPDVARDVLDHARASIPLALASFAPDGGCVEGPGYWSYAMQYTSYYFAALQTALGTDFGQLASPGLSETGLFRIHSIGPTLKTFNFADAHDGVGPAPEMFFLARAFHRPAYQSHEQHLIDRLGANHISPFHLLWYTPTPSGGTDIPVGDEPKARASSRGTGDPPVSSSSLDSLPTSAFYQRINVAFFGTDWSDTASYVGFKGGDNAANHAHLDLGTFVFDSQGQRWAIDLGPDDYNLPGYFGNQRWDYYRLQTQGHNVVTVENHNQNPKASAPITTFSADRKLAIADLTRGYAKDLTGARRGVRLLNDGGLLVQDELQSDHPVDITWNLHTRAKIAVSKNGRSATLTQSGKTLTLQILSPERASFATAEADAPPPVKSTVPTGEVRKPGQKLIVRLPEKVEKTTIAITLDPAANAEPPPIVPLSEWAQ